MKKSWAHQEACPHNQATTVTKLHVTCRVCWRPSLLNAFRPRWNSVTGYGSWGLEAAHNPRPAAPDWPYTCRVWRRYHAHEVVDKECRHMRMHMWGGYDDINQNSEYGNATWKFAPLLTLPLNPILCNSVHHSYSWSAIPIIKTRHHTQKLVTNRSSYQSPSTSLTTKPLLSLLYHSFLTCSLYTLPTFTWPMHAWPHQTFAKPSTNSFHITTSPS